MLHHGRITGLPLRMDGCYYSRMSTLTEIEQATGSLSADELRALLGHVEARLKMAESGGRSEAVERLMQTLRELSRPMGGKSWTTRDELHER
jgi:hypothetical protein